MDRFQQFQQKIVPNILLSKFVYPTNKTIPTLKRLRIGVFLPRDLSVGALTILFSRKSVFARAYNKRDKTYRLTEATWTSNKNSVFSDLHLLTNILLPFQFEQQESSVVKTKSNEITTRFPQCTPPTHLDILFTNAQQYDESFDLFVNFRFSLTKPVKQPETEEVFFLRLFQLPFKSNNEVKYS